MTEKRAVLFDRVSGALLILWAGMALGIALVAAPVVFQQLPGWVRAGEVLGVCFWWIDLLSWFAFGLPFLLSYGTRWLAEMKDDGIGPMRLWSAAALAALLMCFTSMVIVNPKLEAIRLRVGAPLESLPENAPDRAAFKRAHSVSKQLLVLRILLALGLAAGVFVLPRKVEG